MISKDWMDRFYYDFEEAHRGNKNITREKLKFYLPLFNLYRDKLPETPKFLDIGCGRGEFLELARETGFEVEGVEVNSIYVDMCAKSGFSVYNTDGLNFLKSRQDQSYHIISLIHVIEHLEIDYLIELLKEIHRVLKPGGSLILETPYAQNPSVGLYYFWIDPTHKKPVHDELIVFLGRKVGFDVVETVGINAHATARPLSLYSLFFLSAADISIILAKRTPDSEFYNTVIQSLRKLKERSSKGLEELTRLYDESFGEFMERTHAELHSTSEITQAIREDLENLKALFKNVDSELREIAGSLHAISSAVRAVQHSKLWRFYSGLSALKHRMLTGARSVGFSLFEQIQKKPKIYGSITGCLSKVPRIKALLRSALLEAPNVTTPTITTNIDILLDIEDKFILKKLKRYKGEGTV